MNLDLSEEETAAITRKLANLMGNDRHQMSERFRRPKAILAKLRPAQVPEPLRAPKVYAPPKATAATRRRRG